MLSFAAMKYIALLISLYMTVLAIMPCRDQQEKDATLTFHTTIQKSHSCDTACGQETCSPFCTCVCCSTVRVLEQQSLFKLAGIHFSNSYPLQVIAALKNISLSVWQPPQLS